MPAYEVMRLFFHLVSKHETIPDVQGAEVADVCEAQVTVLEFLQEQRHDPPFTLNMSGWTLRATDASGGVSFDLDNLTQ